jgi:hypothetical protein
MVEGRTGIGNVGTNLAKLRVKAVVVALAISSTMVLVSLSSQPAEAIGWGPRVLITDDNANNTAHSGEPIIATDIFRNVHVVWGDKSDLDNSGPDTDIFYRKWNSTIKSWSKRVLLSRDTTNSSHVSGLSSDSLGNIHVMWRDLNMSAVFPYKNTIHHRMWSISSGSWEVVDFTANDTTTYFRVPRIAGDPFGNIHLIVRSSQSCISHMEWNGTTHSWSTPSVISENGTHPHRPELSVDGEGNVHLVWDDDTDILGSGTDWDIYHRMLDRTTGLWGPVQLVTNDNLNNTETSSSPKVGADPFGNVHVVWFQEHGLDGSGPDSDIFYKRFDAATGTWGRRVLVTDDIANTGYSMRQRVAVDFLGNAHVVWSDTSDLDGSGVTDYDIFYRKWNVSAGFWEGRFLVTSFNDNPYNAYHPHVAADLLGNAHVTWVDGNLGDGGGDDADIYYRKWQAGSIPPDYFPIDVSPSMTQHVFIGSSNPISAKVCNRGSVSNISSSIGFFNYTTPASPFFQAIVPPLKTAEKSSPYEATWEAPLTPGTYEITIKVDFGDSISEISENNNYHTIEFIVEDPQRPPTDLTTEVTNNDDILLNWIAPDSSFLDHYLIYRAMDQRGFNFSDPVYDTSNDINPLRTNWTDIDAASPSAAREYYYTARAVNQLGFMSITSNTAGKWTRSFREVRDAFSLPLEPFVNRNVSWYSENIPRTEFVRWMSATGHWVTHYPSMGEGVNDIPATMGDSYEISLSSSINFTFCGHPASMIRFHEGLGDSLSFRKSLTAKFVSSDIYLNWEAEVGASEYLIYRSEKRNGLHNLSLSPIANTAGTSWVDAGVVGNESSEHYYMIMPVDSLGEVGSGTFSVGVLAMEFQSGSDTIALPLKPVEPHTIDWYCDNIPNIVGIIHLMKGYWKLHAIEMPEGVYDADALQGEGYQISSNGSATRFTFIGY